MIKLNVRRNKELEIKIVNLTEQLIQNVIKASLTYEYEKSFILEDAQNLILELSELIHDLIQDEEHLESMLNQLIFQKLPGDHILESFEDFKDVLAELIQKGVSKYRLSLSENQPEEEVYEEDISNEIKVKNINPPNEAPVYNKKETDKLIFQIKRIFPGISIEKDVPYKGRKFQYYIPQMKIVVELQDNKEDLNGAKGFKDLIAEKEGYKIVRIPPNYSLSTLKKLIKL